MGTQSLNSIGIDEVMAERLAVKLNDLLANYSVFYQNTRGYHWNIKGQMFFELHAKFEELYTDLFEKIDEVAERILTLGYVPCHRFGEYLGKSEVPESTEVSNGTRAVEEIVKAFGVLLFKQRDILDLSAQGNDEGTHALMSDYIREQEKLVWMYESFLK